MSDHSLSIVGIIQLSTEIVNYVGSAAGATKERIRLRNEVLGCEAILQQLRDETMENEEGGKWVETINALEAPDGPLGRLWNAMSVVKKRLQPQKGVGKALATLKWPFDQKEVDKIIATMEREKTLLELALANNSRMMIVAVKKSSENNASKLEELIHMLATTSISSQAGIAGVGKMVNSVCDSNKDIKSDVDMLRKHQVEDDRITILEWLTPLNYSNQQNDFINRRQNGTGLWFLALEKYSSWENGANQTLFCPGIPGAGKTILVSAIVDHLIKNLPDGNTIGIAYIYCSFQHHQQQTVGSLLASLLKQLAQGLVPLPVELKELYSQHSSRFSKASVEEIRGLLVSVANMYSKSTIIIDALDECEQSNGCQAQFLTEVFNLQSKCNINLLVTSRFIPEITSRFGDAASIEIRAPDADVRSYLNNQMSRLPGFVRTNPNLQEDIKAGIIKAVDGMFLLAKLHIDTLVGKKSPKSVRTALSNLATGNRAYDQAYNEAMGRIQGQVQDQEELAMQVLSWIAYAKRPLTSTELQHALAVEVDELELDEENLPQVEDIVSVCAGLVTIDAQNRSIRLVHHTTQEYFDRTRNTWFLTGEDQIATTCIAYLSLQVFQSGFCQNIDQLRKRLKLYPLYDYAAKTWGHHTRGASTDVKHLALRFLQNRENMLAASQLVISGDFERFSNLGAMSRDVTALHLAACFGLHEFIIPELINGGYSALSKDFGERTPLWWAARNDHEDSAMNLLQCMDGTDVDYADKEFQRTLLWWAANHGHEKLAEKLLAINDVNPNKPDYERCPPLASAAKNGHGNIVSMLIHGRETINFRCRDTKFGRTAFSWAAQNGHIHVVRLLIAASNFHLERRDTARQTPLLIAVRHGHNEIAKLLLDAGAKPDVQDAERRCPLSYAAMGGDIEMVKLLLSSNKVDPNSFDEDGRTPLSLAVINGDEKIIELLISAGSTSDTETSLWWAAFKGYENIVKLLLAIKGARKKNGSTALKYAMDTGNEAAIKILLAGGADPNWGDDKRSKNALLAWAMHNNNEEITKMLLSTVSDKTQQKSLLADVSKGRFGMIEIFGSTNCNLNCRDTHGRTPLWWAARHGNVGATKLLLCTESVDINRPDFQLRSPLSIAAENGYDEIVKLLLDNDQSEPDAGDMHDRTPLWWASMKGNYKVVELLLATNAVSPNSKTKSPYKTSLSIEGDETATLLPALNQDENTQVYDKHGKTPLLIAVREGHVEVVKLLLGASDIEPNLSDFDGQTALSKASMNGSEWIVKLLLSVDGVNPNSKDEDARTPLWWAAKNGHADIVRVLLATDAIEPDSKDIAWQTPLSCAAINGNAEIVKLLLATPGVQPGLGDKNERTPFWWAVKQSHEDVVKLLINADGADSDVTDKDGFSPLWWAIRNQHEAITNLLLATGDIKNDHKVKFSETLQDSPAQKNDDDKLKLYFLPQTVGVQYFSPLIWAASIGNGDILHRLAKCTVDFNQTDKEGRTPLWWAASNGHTAVVRLLLSSYGAKDDLQDYEGRTPLSMASVNGHISVVETMLTSKVGTHDYQDALSWASYRGHACIVKLLLNIEGIDPNPKDEDGRTPLFWAAYRGHNSVVELLIAKDGIELNSRDKGGGTPMWWAARLGHSSVLETFLSTDQVDLTVADQDGRTALWWAAWNGDAEMLKLLLEKEETRQSYRDCFLWAACNGHIEVMKLLIERSPTEVDSRDNDGHTPLWYAVVNGNIALVKLLLETGKASCAWKDDKGCTLKSIAIERGDSEIANLL